MARVRDLNREQHWRKHHFHEHSSELSITAYCQRECISAAVFYAWKHRLGAVLVPAVSNPLSSFLLKPPPCHIESMPRRTQVSRFDCHSKSTSASLLCLSLNGCAALSRDWPISQTRRPCHDPAPFDRPNFSVRMAG